MAELADALVLGSSVPDVQVQVLLAACLIKSRIVAYFAMMRDFLCVANVFVLLRGVQLHVVKRRIFPYFSILS